MIRLVLSSELLGFFYFLFQNIPEPDKLSWFDQYGPLSVAALAIITNFYFLRMSNRRDMERDKQIAKRDEDNTQALRLVAGAMEKTSDALSENNTKLATLITIVDQRLPR